MKRLLFSILLLSIGFDAWSAPIHAMTFNIRYGSANDGEDSWIFRRGLVMDVIGAHSPDVLCLQEALRFQLDEIGSEFSNYREIGVSRMGNQKDEYAPILFDTTRLKVLESGTFWFSDTPDIPSTHWGNRYLRICTWGRFHDLSTGSEIWVFNVHWDHESQQARVRSAELLVKKVSEFVGDDPFLIAGDFNAGEISKSIRALNAGFKKETNFSIQDSYRVIHPDADQVGTFNRFQGDRSGEKIDFIFVSEFIKTLDAEIVHFNDEGRYPSDHFPVVAEIDW